MAAIYKSYLFSIGMRGMKLESRLSHYTTEIFSNLLTFFLWRITSRSIGNRCFNSTSYNSQFVVIFVANPHILAVVRWNYWRIATFQINEAKSFRWQFCLFNLLLILYNFLLKGTLGQRVIWGNVTANLKVWCILKKWSRCFPIFSLVLFKYSLAFSSP